MKKLKGFTLVELVITIAIVIILSVVSVPIYKSYTKQAKMTEGYALLGTIFSAQKSYYSQYGNFLDDNQSYGNNGWTFNDEVLGINAAGNKYFTMFSINQDYGRISTAFAAIVLMPEELGGKSLVVSYNITQGSTYLIKQ